MTRKWIFLVPLACKHWSLKIIFLQILFPSESHNLSNHSLLLLLLIDLPSAPFPVISVQYKYCSFPEEVNTSFLFILMKNHSIFKPLVWNEDIQETGLEFHSGPLSMWARGYCKDSHDILSKQDKHIWSWCNVYKVKLGSCSSNWNNTRAPRGLGHYMSLFLQANIWA